MAIVADLVDVVVGVDTHTDSHTAAVVDCRGALLAELTVTADPNGAAELVVFVQAHTTAGGRRLWAVEGTRSHGQGLVVVLHAAGETVVEAPPPPAAGRRRGGKSDRLDAVHAARSVLGRELATLAQPRADGPREALRILLTCRRHHTDVRTATVNLIKSLILTADDDLRRRLRGLPTATQIRVLSTTTDEHPDIEASTRRAQLALLARQVTDLDRTLATNYTQLRTQITAICAPLLAEPGVGPVTAAVAYTRWSHPGRVRNEAAYATLAGAAPIPASSGRTDRHRLNRGGDRTLNSALHTIVMTRRRIHQPTRDYIARRTGEGRTTREATRCLKRYLARRLYRLMQTHATQPTP